MKHSFKRRTLIYRPYYKYLMVINNSPYYNRIALYIPVLGNMEFHCTELIDLLCLNSISLSIFKLSVSLRCSGGNTSSNLIFTALGAIPSNNVEILK